MVVSPAFMTLRSFATCGHTDYGSYIVHRYIRLGGQDAPSQLELLRGTSFPIKRSPKRVQEVSISSGELRKGLTRACLSSANAHFSSVKVLVRKPQVQKA
jgi:hypothetical protein